MRRKWHIRTRILVTLTGLTCGVLLVVALTFNAAIRSYIRSRVSAQLTTVSQEASEQRKGDPGSIRGGRRFDEHPDRVTGTRGNAVILNEDGSLCAVLHGDDAVGEELAEYFAGQGLTGSIEYKVITTESGSYAVSVMKDEVKEEQYLLTYVDVTST